MNGLKRFGRVGWRVVTKAGLAMAALFAVGFAIGQVAFPQLDAPITTFGLEASDWDVSPTSSVKRAPYHAKTPTSIPGARVIKTLELKELLAVNKNVVVIDTLGGKDRQSIPGALLLAGSGDTQFYRPEKIKFEAALNKLTGTDKNRPLVFLCLNSECWVSYNAALHALEAGYKDVIWYRGGTIAWTAAKFGVAAVQNVAW